MNNKKIHVCVHLDLDGGASAICIINHIKQKYGMHTEYNLHFATYKNIEYYIERLLDHPETIEKLFIADIHISPELAKDVYQELGDRFILLDHHDSAKNLIGIPNCIISTSGKMCGAAMCYKYLLKDVGLEYKHLTKLVALANDYDLWKHLLPNNIAKNMNYIFYHYWGEKFVERFQMGFDRFTKEEQSIIDQKWKDIEESFTTTKFIDVLENDPLHKNKFCVIPVSDNKDGEVNELCEYALKKLNYHIVMYVNSKKRKVSVRTSSRVLEKGLHVGNFNMENAWGGGHPTAGGFSYYDDEQLETICSAYAEKIVELGI